MIFKKSMMVAFLITSLIYSTLASSVSDVDSSKSVFQIQRIYLKEALIEQPNSPSIFLQTDSPNVEIIVDTGTKKLNDKMYESTVSVIVTGKIKNQTAFVIKAKQAGVFVIDNVSKPQIESVLSSGIPNILYPYLRSNVADLVTRTSFPPIHLPEIDWNAWAEQHKRKSP
jgi:preprotein translocase subunit SecB